MITLLYSIPVYFQSVLIEIPVWVVFGVALLYSIPVCLRSAVVVIPVVRWVVPVIVFGAVVLGVVFNYGFVVFVAIGVFIIRSVYGFGYGDAPEPWQLGFQDAGSSTMEEVIYFHDEILFILCVIITAVLFLIIRALNTRHYHRYLIEGTLIEIIWTLIPAFILMFAVSPSLNLVYAMEEDLTASGLTIKVVGHQWYWSYEYSDYGAYAIEFDSYMIPTAFLSSGELRLLEVDYRLVVPIQTQVRLLVTGADVLHSFAVPSLSVKIDAVPGRLNQTSFFITRSGLFYGQCSEICGVNHSFMPIVVEAVSYEHYIAWVYAGLYVNPVEPYCQWLVEQPPRR